MKAFFLIIVSSFLVSFTETPEPKFKIQVIDNQISIGYGLAIGDVDGDKKLDILLADQKDIVWYRNGDWKRFVMASNLTERDNVCIAARDIDGDGKVEVAVGAQWNPSETTDTTKSGAIFYLVRPQDPTQRWEPVAILPHEATTHRMKWVEVAPKRFQLVVVPLHGRGNQNGEGQGVKVYGYEFPKNPHDSWKRYLVDSTMHLTHNFDLRSDNPAIILGGKEGVKMLGFREAQDKWASVGMFALNHEIGEVRLARFDSSFMATIEPMHGNMLVVYGKGRKVLLDSLSQGHALVCGDFLKTGTDQIAVGWRNPNANKKVGVRLFVPPTKTGENWKEFVIDDSVLMACEDMQAADLDGDGDLDLIASGRSTLNLIVYWNQLK